MVNSDDLILYNEVDSLELGGDVFPTTTQVASPHRQLSVVSGRSPLSNA